MSALIAALFTLLARWPLWLLHGLGDLSGWLVWLASPTWRRRLRENAAQAGYAPAQVRGAVAQAGRMVLELPRLWFGPPVPVRWDGAERVDAALAGGRGLIFLTPHLGCFEITAQAYAARWGDRYPVTVLFRPPRKAALRGLVARARQRPGLRALPTSLAGVKGLIAALRAGHAVGLLPDQVPPLGLGVWAPFFGRDAYSMTLPARLAAQTGAPVLLIWGERLAWGAGYVIHVETLASPLPAEPVAGAAAVNAAMERLVRGHPQQYLWGYGRYRQPRRLGTATASAGDGS